MHDFAAGRESTNAMHLMHLVIIILCLQYHKNVFHFSVVKIAKTSLSLNVLLTFQFHLSVLVIRQGWS